MHSICTACDKDFYGKSNELRAWQLPGVTCPERAAPHLCENSKCKYFFDEEYDYGCTSFILCDECMRNPEAILRMLEDYDRL